MQLDEIERSLRDAGLSPRGAFHPGAGDGVPPFAAEPACMDLGCRARDACPVGRDYRYAPGQANFHMQAFRLNHLPEDEATN